MGISKTLKKIMIDKDIKQVDVADALGLLKQSLSRQLTADDFKLSDITKIADALGFDVNVQLIDRDTGDVIDAKQKSSLSEAL